MAFSDVIQRAILDHFLSTVFTAPGTWTPPAALHVGLSSSTPTSAGGNVTEPTGGSYARVELTQAANPFPAATGQDPAESDNPNDVVFPTATADWLGGVNLTHFVVYSAATGGTFLGFGALTTPQGVLNGNQARFPAGDLNFRAQ